MNRKAQQRATNTQKIIEHAEILFAEKGFNGTSTQDIAVSTGLPKSNIHYYFQTKQDLYSAVLKNVLSEWMHDADIFEQSDDPETVLRAYIRRKMEHSFTRPNGSRTWAMEIIQGGPVFGKEIRSTLIEWDRKIVKCLQNWIDEGRIRNIDPQTLLYMIWGTTQHYADFEYQVVTLNRGRRLSAKQRESAIQNVSDIIIAGVIG